MNRTTHGAVSRRRFLGTLLTAGLATGVTGCLANDTDETETATPGGLPSSGGDGSGDTSLAGSCAAAFGDTDQRYDPGDRPLVVTFAYPMAGEVYEESASDGEVVTAIGYAPVDGGYEQTLRVTQRGPVEDDSVGERYAEREGWEAGETVTYDGDDYAVAVRRTADTSLAWVVGVPGPDGTYEIVVEAAVDAGEPCPETYASVCERVAQSLQPR